MTPLGTGFYTNTDAARILQVRSRDVSRWMFGYDFTSKRADGQRVKHHSDPLWKTQYADDPDLNRSAIGFLDLLELRIVREFVNVGVPLSIVRRCLEAAKTLFDAAYPLTTQRFLTDGRTVFAEAMKDDPDAALLDLRTRQYAFKSIIKPSLYAGIEYDGERAARWYPDARTKSVMLDPDIQFGKPVVARSAIPTAALYLAYVAEGSDDSAASTVARIYEVPRKDVLAAVRFETELKAA